MAFRLSKTLSTSHSDWLVLLQRNSPGNRSGSERQDDVCQPFSPASFVRRIDKCCKPVVFINENKTVANDALSEESGADDVDIDYDSLSASEDGYPRGSRHSSGAAYASAPSQGGSPTDRFFRQGRQDMGGRHRASPLIRQQIFLDKSVVPFTDPNEATLFRHFIQKLAIWVRSPELLFIKPTTSYAPY